MSRAKVLATIAVLIGLFTPYSLRNSRSGSYRCGPGSRPFRSTTAILSYDSPRIAISPTRRDGISSS